MPQSIADNFKRNNAISRYGLYGHALSHEPLTQG